MPTKLKEIESDFFHGVGGRLRKARLGSNLTQVDMGDVIGVTFQQIQKYEDGIHRISIFKLLRWAEATGKPVSYFYVGEDCE